MYWRDGVAYGTQQQQQQQARKMPPASLRPSPYLSTLLYAYPLVGYNNSNLYPNPNPTHGTYLRVFHTRDNP